MKLWVAYTPDYNGARFEFHYRWWHQAGGNKAEQPAHEHLDILDTQVIGGRQWVQYQYVIQTEDVSANGAFNWYVGYRPDNTAGARFITDISFSETTDQTAKCHFLGTAELCGTDGGHNAGNSFVTLPNPANDAKVLRQSGSNTEYQLNPIVEDNKRYKMKLWVAYTPDYNGARFEFHYRWWHQAGGNKAEQPAHEHLDILDTQVIGGRQWVQYQYVIQTEDVSANGAFNWYVGYRPDNTAGARFITDITFEETTDPATEDATSFEEVRFAIETDKSAAEIQANLPVYTQAVASTLGLATSQCSLSVVAARRRLVEGNTGATILVTIADITVNTQTSILTAVTSPVFTTSVSTQMQTAGVTTSLVVDATAVSTCSVACSANTGILRVTHDTSSKHTHHKCYVSDAGAGNCMCACCDATVSNCDVQSNYAL